MIIMNGRAHFRDCKNGNTTSIPTKYKAPTPRLCKISRAALLVFLAIRVVNLIMLCFGISLYVGTLSQSVCGYIIDLLILLFCVFSINFPFKKLYFIPLAVFVLIGLIYGTNLHSYTSDTTFREFSSPNEEETIVIRQSGYLYSGETKFYEKHAFFIKYTGEKIERDDYYQEITKAKIEVDWKDEKTADFSYFNADTGELLLQKTINI